MAVTFPFHATLLGSPNPIAEQLSDAELIHRIGQGGSGSGGEFRVLVERYQGQVFGLLARMGFDRDTAEDLAQESFVRAWKALPSFRGDSQFNTWLYRIVYRQALQFLRHRGRQQRLLTQAQEVRDVQPSPLGAHQHTELRQTLEKCLRQLPDAQQMALALYYFQEQSYQEVAEVMEVPLNTVKTHIRRGKLKLREIMGEGAQA